MMRSTILTAIVLCLPFWYGCGSSESVSIKPAAAKASSPEPPEGESLASLVERVEPAVVRINTKRDGKDYALGSGFLISADGLVVTNKHVIEKADDAEVVFADGQRLAVQGVVIKDEEQDIAVLRIKSEVPLPFVELATREPKKGESVIAMGTPRGLSFSVTEGIVSALRDGSEFQDLFDETKPGRWIQTSAPITNGNSGGPLFDRQGKVVGINTWIATGGSNLGFAVTAGSVRPVIEQARSSQTHEELSSLAIKADSSAKEEPGENYLQEGLAQLAVVKAEREKELSQIRQSIETLARQKREAFVQVDEAGQQRYQMHIEIHQRDLKALLRKPLAIPYLQLGEGVPGSLVRVPPSISFYVVQILGRDPTLVLMSGPGKHVLLFINISVDRLQPLDRIRARDDHYFVVGGPFDYKSRDDRDLRAETLLFLPEEDVSAGLDVYFEIAEQKFETFELSAAEQARYDENKSRQEALMLAQKAKEDQIKAEAAAKRKEEAMKADQMRKLNAGRARLKQAESLISRDRFPQARLLLEQVIEQLPGTDEEKEAQRLLKKISR